MRRRTSPCPCTPATRSCCQSCRTASSSPASRAPGKGEMGSALMESLQILCLSTEGLFGYQSVNICQHLSNYVNCAYCLSLSVKTHYFCSGPISVDLFRPQPDTSQTRPSPPRSVARRVSTHHLSATICPQPSYIVKRRIATQHLDLPMLIAMHECLISNPPRYREALPSSARTGSSSSTWRPPGGVPRARNEIAHNYG